MQRFKAILFSKLFRGFLLQDSGVMKEFGKITTIGSINNIILCQKQ